MDASRFKKNKIYTLPVKEIRAENTRSFYIVEADGEEYAIPLFEFQKDDPTPERLSCLVKDVHDGVPVFTQNFAPIIARFYEEAKVYPFWVRNDFTQIPNGYYEVADWNGLYFRLQFYGNAKLHVRQRIECRVRSLRENKLCLELVNKGDGGRKIPFLRLRDILQAVHVEPGVLVWADRLFRKSKLFKDAREAFLCDNEEWIVIAIKSLAKNMDLWVVAGNKRNSLYLNLFRNVCIYLLEDSDTLTKCTEQERKAYQTMLSDAIEDTYIYEEAVRLIAQNGHVQCIDSLLRKMQKSGYLYHPERKLKMLMCIFNLQPDIMEEKMQVIFDTILTGDKANWRTEPFRSAFISMLSLFIEKKRIHIDRLSSIENEEAHENLTRLIKALAIQLLLANERDHFERQLNRAMLYRYLTYVKGSKKEVLFEKAFDSLTDAVQYKLEFGWNEVHDILLLAIRLSSSFSDNRQKKTTVMQTYNGLNCRLQIMNGNIYIQSSEKAKLFPCLPEKMLPWHNIQIFLPENKDLSVSGTGKELSNYQKFWKNIEYSLLNSPAAQKAVRKNKKLKAEEGEEVYIRIVHQDTANPDYFICTIEDDSLCGEGYINVRNIVRYNIYVDESSFFDENGRPYLLRAKVLSINSEGDLNFTMLDYVNAFVRECVNIGDIVRCIVLDTFNGVYLCVSEDGYSLQLPLGTEEPLNPKDYIEVSISNVRSNNTVEAEFERKIIDSFTVKNAFDNLICSYAEGRVYEEAVGEQDLEQPEVTMEKTYVEEIIHIIDRMAVLEKNYILTYNYLAFTRILALIIKNRDWAVYFNERMRLLQMLQHFVINGKIDEERLKELGQTNRDMINNYPVLETKLLELQIVGCMDNPEQDAFIWNIIASTANNRLSQLAKLVMSYNSLRNFDMSKEREAIRTKISEVLNIRIKMPESVYLGEENQCQEFKTSIVYPADNHMRADLRRQTLEIMKVICGFLNAEGGTLYIGVNNEGVVAGLYMDMAYFKGNRDAFDLHVRNSIVSYMGNEANSLVRASFTSYAGKWVYVLEIQPCPHPVRVEGIVYQRQGSSTWPLLDEALDSFLSLRNTEAEPSVQPVSAADENTPAEAETDTGTAEKAKEEKTAKPAMMPDEKESQIETSALRENPIHSWDDNFGVESVCYLHFLPNYTYKVTPDVYWEKADLTLVIRTGEEYVVLVYENGEALKVPVSEILDKKFNSKYKRCKCSRLVFACPAKGTDALLWSVRNSSGLRCLRLDDVALLKRGTMSDFGEPVSTVENMGVVQCEIIASKHFHNLKKIHNMRKTQIGGILSEEWGQEELAYLRKLGMNVRD